MSNGSTPYTPDFTAVLQVDPSGTVESLRVPFNFNNCPELVANNDSIATSPAPVISAIVPRGQPALNYSLVSNVNNVVTIRLGEGASVPFLGLGPYTFSVHAYTVGGSIVIQTCTLTIGGPGYVPYHPAGGIIPNGPTGNFSGLPIADGIIPTAPVFQFTTANFAPVATAGTFVNPGQVATAIQLAASGQVLGFNKTPTTLPTVDNVTTFLPPAASVPFAAYKLTFGTKAVVVSNGARWINLIGSKIVSTDFGDDPTGASGSATAWQNACTALANAGGGKLWIPAYYYDQTGVHVAAYNWDHTIVVTPVNTTTEVTIEIEFEGFQNQITWTGPQYAVGLIVMGLANCKLINLSPRNVSSIDGFQAFDTRIDYNWPGNTNVEYINCIPNLGGNTGVAGFNGQNSVGFRTGQGGTGATNPGLPGGGGLINGKYSFCTVLADSQGTTAHPDQGSLAFQPGGSNSYRIKYELCTANQCTWRYQAGARQYFQTASYFGPNDLTITNLNSTLGLSPTGFVQIWSGYVSGPCELAYYTSITSSTMTFPQWGRGLNGTSPLQGSGNVIITPFLTDVYGAFAISSASIGTSDTSISVGTNNNTLASAGTLQITSSTGIANAAGRGVFNGDCYPYETMTYTSNSSNTIGGITRQQLGSPNGSFQFFLPPPTVQVFTAPGSSGSWTATTAWVQWTYNTSAGETTPSPIQSIAIPNNGSLIITTPQGTGYTLNGPATSCNIYVGTGATQPANSAMYRQNVSPVTLALNNTTNYTISSNPTTSGANPPTTSTAPGGNGYVLFQRQYGPSMGSLLAAGLVDFDNCSSFGCANEFACTGPHHITISGDESESCRGDYIYTGLLPGLGAQQIPNSITMKGCRIIGSWTTLSQRVFNLNGTTNLNWTGGVLLSKNGTLTQPLFMSAPCHVRWEGIGLNASDPFYGDSSGQSVVEFIGCWPTTSTGTRITTGQYATYPYFSTPGIPIPLTDSANIGIILTNNIVYILQMLTLSSRTISFNEVIGGALVTLIIQQPTSGGPLTATIPSNVTWVGGPSGANTTIPLDPNPSAYTVVSFRVIPVTGGGKVVVANVNGSQISNSILTGIGYSKGGTVTQLTNKSTSVTLNTLSGQITLNNAQLNAGASVAFTWNNSSLLADDVIDWQIVGTSASDPTAYIIAASNITAGTSCSVTVRNVSASNLSEAIVLQFCITRGATS